jgi:hypothetical protein
VSKLIPRAYTIEKSIAKHHKSCKFRGSFPNRAQNQLQTRRSFIRALLSIIMIYALHFRGKGNGCFPKSPLDETRSSNFDTRSTKCGEKRECNYFAASHPSVLVAGASPHERVSNGCTRACIQEKYDASYQHHRAESALRCRKPNGKPSGKRCTPDTQYSAPCAAGSIGHN